MESLNGLILMENRRVVLFTATIFALLVTTGCSDDCDTVPCGDCVRPPAEIFATEIMVSDTLGARTAYEEYSMALAKDAELMPPTLKFFGTENIEYVSSNLGFERDGVQYWKILVSSSDQDHAGLFHQLYVSELGMIVEELLCY
jgi:hypothetical protein